MGSDRRRRLSLPWTLKIAGILMTALPLLNWLGAAWQLGSNPLDYYRIWLALNWIEKLLLVLPFFAGIGLLRGRSLGWYLCILYSILLLGYNTWLWSQKTNTFYGMYLLQAIVGIALFFYFIRRDTGAPYMDNIPRGWRHAQRQPIHQAIELDTHPCVTQDLSPRGFYATGIQGDFQLNQSVNIKLGDLELQGGVVRMDSKGLGIAFRNTSPSADKAIGTIIKNAEKRMNE